LSRNGERQSSGIYSGIWLQGQGKNEKNDTATCFYAASLAKPLFAYIVMHLVDEKLIELDKPLYTYLPKPILNMKIIKI
jgi:CubicO group peptidase (beta-lactamase class C family)